MKFGVLGSLVVGALITSLTDAHVRQYDFSSPPLSKQPSPIIQSSDELYYNSISSISKRPTENDIKTTSPTASAFGATSATHVVASSVGDAADESASMLSSDTISPLPAASTVTKSFIPSLNFARSQSLAISTKNEPSILNATTATERKLFSNVDESTQPSLTSTKSKVPDIGNDFTSVSNATAMQAPIPSSYIRSPVPYPDRRLSDVTPIETNPSGLYGPNFDVDTSDVISMGSISPENNLGDLMGPNHHVEYDGDVLKVKTSGTDTVGDLMGPQHATMYSGDVISIERNPNGLYGPDFDVDTSDVISIGSIPPENNLGDLMGPDHRVEYDGDVLEVKTSGEKGFTPTPTRCLAMEAGIGCPSNPTLSPTPLGTVVPVPMPLPEANSNDGRDEAHNNVDVGDHELPWIPMANPNEAPWWSTSPWSNLSDVCDGWWSNASDTDSIGSNEDPFIFDPNEVPRLPDPNEMPHTFNQNEGTLMPTLPEVPSLPLSSLVSPGALPFSPPFPMTPTLPLSSLPLPISSGALPSLPGILPSLPGFVPSLPGVLPSLPGILTSLPLPISPGALPTLISPIGAGRLMTPGGLLAGGLPTGVIGSLFSPTDVIGGIGVGTSVASAVGGIWVGAIGDWFGSVFSHDSSNEKPKSTEAPSSPLIPIATEETSTLTPVPAPTSHNGAPAPTKTSNSLPLPTSHTEETIRPTSTPTPSKPTPVSNTPAPTSTKTATSPAPIPIPIINNSTPAPVNSTFAPTPTPISTPTPANPTDHPSPTPISNTSAPILTNSTTPASANSTDHPTPTPVSNTSTPILANTTRPAPANATDHPTSTPASITNTSSPMPTNRTTPIPSTNPTRTPTPAPTPTPTPKPTPTPEPKPSPAIKSVVSDAKPYIAGIRTAISNTTYCTGALIAPKYVLTSNLCNLYGADTLYVSIGTVKRSNSNDGGDHSKVVKIIPHPKYNRATREYDFLLLELETASSKTPVTLPSASQKTDSYGQYAQALGWNSDDDEITRTELLSTTMTYLNQTDCARTLGIPMYDTQTCAFGSTATSACHFNDGNPLVSHIGGKDVLAGLVCYRNGCAMLGAPTLFSLTSSVRDWIKSTARV